MQQDTTLRWNAMTADSDTGTPHDCPNCGKEGQLFENSPPKRYCNDRACPVLTYNWEHTDG